MANTGRIQWFRRLVRHNVEFECHSLGIVQGVLRDVIEENMARCVVWVGAAHPEAVQGMLSIAIDDIRSIRDRGLADNYRIVP